MRRRVRTDPQTSDDNLVTWFITADSDVFERNFFGDRLFASQEHARRAWPRCRRGVWLQTWRMRVPDGARVFDGLTVSASERLLSVWNHLVFPLSDVLAALEADRARLLAFERRDPRAASQIAAILDTFRNDLDLLESQARALAQSSGDRLYPLKGWPSGTYGGGGEPPADAW